MVETYGRIDELNSSMGFARSICEDQEIAAFTKGVQQDLFRIGSLLATPTESPKPQIAIEPALVGRLNRLSDLLWLFGRKLERDAGISGSLREAAGKSGNRFSRAW